MAGRRGIAQPRGADRVRWMPAVEHAAELIEASPLGMTLRGVFYRLVSEGRLPNTNGYYSTLSRRSAEARRAGWFPDLIDRTRRILRPQRFESPAQAQEWLRRIYRRDRTEGQEWAIYLGVEKNALAGAVESWFEDLGIPVLPLGGYGSQTFKDVVVRDVEDELGDSRRSVLIYAGDFDPSGEDIERDFRQRTNFDRYERVALDLGQVEEHELPPHVGKASDPRAAGFMERHGKLIQVELDALPLETLRDLYQEAIDRYFNMAKYEAVLKRENTERRNLSDSHNEED